MWVIILILFLIIALEALIQAFEMVFTSLPYVCAWILSVGLFFGVEGLKNLVPGHSVMSYISVLGILVFITFVMTRIKQISFSFVILCCTFLMCLVFSFVSYGTAPDSVQFCIFMTIAFSVILLASIVLNIVKYGEVNDKDGNMFFSIIKGLLNAFSVCCYVVAVGYLWAKYFGTVGSAADTIFGIVHWILLIVGCLVAFIFTVIWDRRGIKQEIV